MKLCRANGILSNLRHYAPTEICLQVYYAICSSHLIYGCNIWDLTSKENRKKLEILQKKCKRIMAFSDFRSHTKILKVREIIKLQQLKLLHEFLDNSLPADLKQMFKLKLISTVIKLRQPFYIPAVNSSTHGINSIRYSVPKLYYDTFKNNGISIDEGVNNIVRLDQIHSVLQFK